MIVKNRVRPPKEEPFSSNAVRLHCRGWILTGALVLAVCAGVPLAWERFEPFDPGPDYRIPYELGNDYWLYARYSKLASREHKVLVLGDSVIWGEYVTPQDTLPHHLNQLDGATRFLNLGVDGIHPAAMSGLISYYGRAIRGQDVVLHFNPLWMSSKRHDLQTDKEFQFNHPKLVAQFAPMIPCYKQPYPDRVSIVVERYLPFRAWSNHLALCYFDTMDVASWVRQNPYSNPLEQVTLEIPPSGTKLRHKPAPWTQTAGGPVGFEWVAPEGSLQWDSFQRTIQTLLARNNRLFVVLGPFNEHMIKPEGLEAYNAIKGTVEGWLSDQHIPHYIPQVLPSDLYADASHPLGPGYALLAQQLLQDDAFRHFLKNGRA